MQRTTLTGWLLLVHGDYQFLRLVAALLVSITFLTALLVCQPYKRWLDYSMAAGCQLLLVCVFIGSIMVYLYEDISNDTAGSEALAFRFLGLRSSEDAVILMIVVSLSMVSVLVVTIGIEAHIHIKQQRLEQKWSVVTMDPPRVRWKLRGIYACFLSHYKMGEYIVPSIDT